MHRFLATLAATSAILIIQSCSGESARNSAARDRGIVDANAFIDLASQKKISQLRLQSFLLSVRDKEYRLRQAGETEAAELYISSFETQLRDSVPDLYLLIVPEK